MASPAHHAHLTDWIWHVQYECWYRVLRSRGHADKRIWHDSYRPLEPASSPYQQPQRWPTPSSRPGPAGNHVSFKQYSLEITHLGQEGSARPSIPFADLVESSRVAYTRGARYILHPMRYFRQPSTSYTVGYCDHHACNDPRCIEDQYGEYGWRDDLRRHEDQDKNGNMRDGDKVGEHCPPPANDVEEDDDEDDEEEDDDDADEEEAEEDDDDDDHAGTTQHTVSYSATPHHTGYYSATQHNPVLTAPHYANAYASRSQGAAPPALYLQPQPTQYQPRYAP